MPRAAAASIVTAWALVSMAWGAAPRQPDVLVLAHATVIDGTGTRPRPNAMVVVRDGRIQYVASWTGRVPAGATVIDLAGRALLPGLFDMHVHPRGAVSSINLLGAGVTTARSLGVDRFGDVAIRDRHRRSTADVPDIIAAGYHVRRRLAEPFFEDFPALRRFAAGVTGPADVREVVRAIASRGVDVIKVMATERAGVREMDLRRRMLTNEELAAAVDEAGKAGLPVAAHAHTDEGARAAIRAGVRTIEHGTLMTPATLRLMKQRGTCFVPTFSFWEDMSTPGGEYDDPLLAARARELLPAARATAAAAVRLGIPVVAGSDMRYDGTSKLTVVDEIASLAAVGLSPLRAIQAATSQAAACAGLSRRTGAIRAGMEADLIVAGGDPLKSLHTLHDLVLVINDGTVVLNRLPR